MANLPAYTLRPKLYFSNSAKNGVLEYKYAPFKNLVKSGEITNFSTTKLNLNINSNVNIEIQPSFDGSVNLILNNDTAAPKLINSRFSVNEGNTFTIVDHKGNKDTSLYDESQLELDTNLYKTTSKISKLEFTGLTNDGNFKCGAYHFYFKYADNDNNETDFILESGLVVCHIGGINNPKEIRMGMQNESANKSVNFKLTNLDTAYDFLKIYYTRSTSDNTQQDVVTAHLIDYKFPITSETLNLKLSGFETEFDVSLAEINPYYQLVNTAKTQAQCQNMLFLGNATKPNIPYEELADLSLHFVPKVVVGESIGNINENYVDFSGKYEYYNAKNLYYNLGYWPEEYYRFGIVYILNDFSLSPVFNIRGLEFNGTDAEEFYLFDDGKRKYIEINDNGFLSKKTNLYENSKGVVKFSNVEVIKSSGVTPLGIQLQVHTKETPEKLLEELKKYTRGFFLVRQERTPTILAQGVIIQKTINNYGNIPVIPVLGSGYVQGFLSDRLDNNINKPILYPNKLKVFSPNLERKAAIIPEAVLREPLFNQLFTGTEFTLTTPKEQSTSRKIGFTNTDYHYYLTRDKIETDTSIYKSKLTNVNSDVKLTTDGDLNYFSARAGEAEEAWQAVNVDFPENKDGGVVAGKINPILTNSSKYIRGVFNSYVGLSNGSLDVATIFNVRPKDFDNSENFKLEMFKTRMNNSSVYKAISDRIEFVDNNALTNLKFYRGDCFIGNFTHRLQRNFADPEMPTIDKVVDINTWSNNFAILQETNGINGTAVNKVLTNYKQKKNDIDAEIIQPSDAKYTNAGSGLSLFSGEAADLKIKGAQNINRIDVNAVPMGSWITLKVMSNINLSMRDLDFSNTAEEAVFRQKRGFFPYQSQNIKAKLPDSNIINGAANVTLSQRNNFEMPDVPFVKNKFDTRILYSDIHITDAFKNGYRVFQGSNYQDYAKTYGGIVDIKESRGNLFVTFEHGIVLIPVNERAVAASGSGGNAYINTDKVLPENPMVISDMYGSIWQESIISTPSGIYGIDTVAKKIWLYVPEQGFNTISDLKVQKFLNDQITLKESDKIPTFGLRNVKSHYNAFKGDVMFTFYNGETEWNLCYNEKTQKFTTYYSWIPSHSANIDNIFLTFDKQASLSTYLTCPTISVPNMNLIKGHNKFNINRWVGDGNYTLTFNARFSAYAGNAASLKVGLYFDEMLDSDWSLIIPTITNTDTAITASFNLTLNNRTQFSIYNTAETAVYISDFQFEKTDTFVNPNISQNKIWKHGQAGNIDGQGIIKPTNWYEKQEPFEFEFVVAESAITQKIFDNLKLISNKATPKSFSFEIVGETYDWFDVKDLIFWMNDQVKKQITGYETLSAAYTRILGMTFAEIDAEYPKFNRPLGKEGVAFNNDKFKKLPYLIRVRSSDATKQFEANSSNIALFSDELLNEDRIQIEQLGNDIKKYGRLKGNMQYCEDAWSVEVRPIIFKYAYLKSGVLTFTDAKESRIRDKYLKVKVKYSGEDLAIIQGIKTIFTNSYA